MERFLVFAGYRYYPRGGYDDYQDGFETLDEAKEYCGRLLRDHGRDWAHVLDIQTGDMYRA